MLGVIAVSFLFLKPLVLNHQGDTKELPLTDWSLYTIKSSKIFWITYIHQLCVILIVGFNTSSFDMLVCNFMMQINSQMRILSYRIKKLTITTKNRQLRTIIDYSLHLDIIYK